MSLIVNGNKIMQSKSIGYELIDDAPLEVIYSVENWVRPSEWISVPTPATGSEVVNILYGVYDSGPNFLSIQASSTFSVDWGDGSSQSASPGSYLRKEFMFGSYSSGTLTSDGFRQALVTVTPNTPGTFTSFNLNGRHSYQSTNYYKPSILEIKMSGRNLTSIGTYAQFDKLVNFEFVGTHSITNMGGIFSSIRGLRKFKMDCTGVTNTSSMFSSSINLREVDISNLQSSANMSNMFSACYSLNTLPVINAANCSTMASMFASCINLEDSPILINTSNVITTSSMFNGCTLLKRVNSFTCSSVTDMSLMFQNCYLLQTIPLLDTAKVTNFNYTFGSSTATIMGLQSIPLLNTASASNMSYMFYNCRSLISDRRNKGIPLLDTSSVTNMSFMFYNCVKIKTIPQFNTRWVSNFRNMFQNCILLSEVPLLNTASASAMDYMFDGCIDLQTVPLFNTQNVTTFTYMFHNCIGLNEVPSFNMATASNVSFMFDCMYTTDISYGGSLYTIPNFNFSSTIASINMTNFLAGQVCLSYIPQLNMTRVSTAAAMFYNCREIKEIPALNMSSVLSTNSMFRSCVNLRKVGALNMPVNTTISFMFLYCYNLQYIESIFTTTLLTVVKNAFQQCYKITQIPVFNTLGVALADAGFNQMFTDCWSLTSAPALNTANVRNFVAAFQNCYSLVTVPNYNISLATDMSYMFNNCISLEYASYNIPSVTNLNYIFQGCTNLVSVTFSNTSAVNNVSTYASFYGCTKLRSVSMPGIRISNPSYLFWNCGVLMDVGTFSVVSAGGAGGGGGYSYMFLGCASLTNLKGLTFSFNAVEFRDMFNGCVSLKETPNFSMAVSGDSGYQTSVFLGCYSLSRINVPSFRYNMSFQLCNLNYVNIKAIIDSYQTANMALTLGGYRTLNFLDNPGLPEMMNFYNRKQVYDKGYTYSANTYNWTELRHYVDAGSTYSYTSGPTFSDVSGWTYNPNLSPTFSTTSTSTADGTLINSPAFSVNNFTFDGINQSIVFGTASATMLSTVTLFIVLEPVSLPAGVTASIFGRYDPSGRDNYFLDFTDGKLRFGFRQSGTATRLQRVLNKTFNVGQRYFIVARHQSSANNCVIWVDGVRETSYFSDNITSQIMDQVSTSILSMGGNYATNSSYANIKVYTAGIYNRLLEDYHVEELQSFFRRKNILL